MEHTLVNKLRGFTNEQFYKVGDKVSYRGKKGTVIQYKGKTPNMIAVEYDEGGIVFPYKDSVDLKKEDEGTPLSRWKPGQDIRTS